MLLASKEFDTLHRNLEALHKVLATHEPRIIAKKRTGDVDDPYEMLGIDYDAKPDQIKAAYTKLKKTQSPEAVQADLKKKKVSEKVAKKKVKEARLSWSFIQSAYDSLRIPKSVH